MPTFASGQDIDLGRAKLVQPDGGSRAIEFDLSDRPEATDAFPIVELSIEPVDGVPTHSGMSVVRAQIV